MNYEEQGYQQVSGKEIQILLTTSALILSENRFNGCRPPVVMHLGFDFGTLLNP